MTAHPMAHTPRIGYCTNVHAGIGLEQTLAQLDIHATAVRNELEGMESDVPLGLGLWLSAETAAELSIGEAGYNARQRLAAWFADRKLAPYTINAFPYGNFHGDRVKHGVYEPSWWMPARANYTLDVARVFHHLLPVGSTGTISTLPVGWRASDVGEEHLDLAAKQLGRVAFALADLEQRDERHLRICIEPEPGCVLERAADVVKFFELLRSKLPEEIIARYLGVCHDVCHAAVMFEPQDEVLAAYAAAEIAVGKVQFSSAIVAKPSRLAKGQSQVIDELRRFAEDRYLHQTTVRTSAGLKFFEDLSLALDALAAPRADSTSPGSERPERPAKELPDEEWRVHYHVPLYLERFGALQTSQEEIDNCLRSLQTHGMQPAMEVETYAWSVLPPALREPALAAGIAKEIRWIRQRLAISSDVL